MGNITILHVSIFGWAGVILGAGAFYVSPRPSGLKTNN